MSARRSAWVEFDFVSTLDIRQYPAYFGWTAGAGVEYAFNNYLSAKVEYMYVNLGTQTQINVDSVKFNTNIVRAGINLHF